MRLLAVDVGNTNITLGVHDGERWILRARLFSDARRTDDEYGLLLRDLLQHHGSRVEELTGVALSSVVPPLTQTLAESSRRYLGIEPFIVGPGIKTGMPIRYKDPRELGTDRLINAVAAYDKVKGPVIVVSFGTATTLDIVSRQGEYLGGVIAPGVGISTEALFERTSKLPRVELVSPGTVICRDTESAIQAGIIYGFAGQVDTLVRKAWQELGDRGVVIARGGLAHLIASASEAIDRVEPELALDGLRLVYQRNRRGGES